MFLCNLMKKTTTLKGFKVTDANRSKTVGIACSSLVDLLNKACKKFEVPKDKARVYLGDGTLVDSEDYFKTIPPQSVLSLVRENETFLTGADMIYNALKLINVQYLRAGEMAQNFLEEDIKGKIRVLSQVINAQEKEEPLEDWLTGVETAAKTKEAFMESRCKDRIKTYFYKACTDIKNSTRYQTHATELNRLINELRVHLTKRGYQGIYFNRTKEPDSLCDSTGLFKCQGAWSRPKCNHCGGLGHSINPYLTRETRIIFSTWNLDHRVERSRSIVPSILDAVSRFEDGVILNTDRIYELLFTKANLKLVHIVCHDKGAHTAAKCDPNELLIRVKNDAKHPRDKADNRKLIPPPAS